ncbi:MAG: hypothetical protein ACYDAL_14100 [Candidatus Dormibacteraceae bacterium]
MSLIGAKRLQQGVFEALASQNRTAGSGGGSGYVPKQLLAAVFNFNTAYTTSSTTDGVVPGVTAAIALPRTGNVEIAVLSTGKVSGAAGEFAYGSLYVDGTLYGHNNNTGVVLWDNLNGGYTSGTIPKVLFLAAGSHTIDFRTHVDNIALTWINYQTVLDVFQLGS